MELELNSSFLFINESIGREDYKNETGSNQTSHFGSNLIILQQLYSNKQNKKIFKKDWAKKTGISKTNFDYWSSHRNTVPDYETVNKIVSFFRTKLDISPTILNVISMVNTNLTGLLIQDINRYDMVFKSYWEHLKLEDKIEFFTDASTEDLNKEDIPENAIHLIPNRYLIELEPGQIKGRTDLINAFIELEDISSQNDIYYCYSFKDNIVFSVQSKSTISVSEIKNIPPYDESLVKVHKDFYKDRPINKKGLLRVIKNGSELSIVLCDIKDRYLKEIDTRLLVYQINKGLSYKLNDAKEYIAFRNKVIESLENQIGKGGLKERLISL